MRLRLVVLVGLVVAALVAGGCSSDAADVPVTAATIATAPTTSSPPVSPASPTAVPTRGVTTTAATNGAATTTAVTTTASATTTRAVTATDPTTTAVPTTTAAPTTTVPAAPADFTPVAGPSVGDQTSAIDPAWLGADGVTLTTVADGTYWATLAGEGDSPQRFVGFKLTQAFFGAACTAKFGD
ncbi:MAG: hypothetical protein ABIR68_08110, partial [Ilumatobacteraceae bacterium]